jgi:PBP1b-binding outer membrane lipoprotein LpoB
MKKLTLMATVVALVLTGCVETTTYWDTSVTNDKVFREDLKKCVYEANLNTQSNMIGEAAANERIKELRDMCLKAKGYKIISKETKHTGKLNLDK